MIRILLKLEGEIPGEKSLIQDLRVLAGLFLPGAEVDSFFQSAAETASIKNPKVEIVEHIGLTGGRAEIPEIILEVRMDLDNGRLYFGFKGVHGVHNLCGSNLCGSDPGGFFSVTNGSDPCGHPSKIEMDLTLLRDFLGRNPLKNAVKLGFYDLMSCYFDVKPAWGILTGIRPVKIVHDLMDTGIMDHEAIKSYLKRHYRVSDEKIRIALEVAGHEHDILNQDHDRISLYLCIPFCATRCLYCSFPSNPLSQKGHLVPKYLEALMVEIETIGKHLTEKGRVVDCVYIGGGTPTSLDESQFEGLLEAIELNLIKPLAPVDGLREYTVEAGRPDTITEKKLRDMSRFGVTRVCINPQTMSDETLVRIGRSHDAAAITETFKLARRIGFEVINADMIVGLPGETLADVAHTVKALCELAPENITVHTLAVKRSSQLNEFRDQYEVGLDEAARQVDLMYETALARFTEVGYEPYYLYRQKNMVGNLENVGLTLADHKCLYNIRMMGDRHSIIALGAGSVSKLVLMEESVPNGNDGFKVERLANAKGLEDYTDRIAALTDAKIEWLTRL